jgi:hypothetical protein
VCRSDALARIFCETAIQDRCEVRRNIVDTRGNCLANGAHDFDRRVSRKRATPGQHLVQHGAEREQVRPCAGLVPANLLRRHVTGCAQHITTVEQIAIVSGVHRLLRQSEIENLHDAVSTDEQIFRLEIAVDDTFLVGRRQTRRDLPRESKGVVQRHRSPLKSRTERFAVEQFRHDVRDLSIEPDVIHRKNVRMIQCR